MAIYVTGDTHGEISRFKNEKIKKLKPGDKLIVCGDFGFVFFERDFFPREFENEKKALDYIETLPFEVLFADGNHENFNRLEKYPKLIKYGSPVHKIRGNIFHLERGYAYNIENKIFFCMGGGYSVDKNTRRPNISWWSREMPNDAEYHRASDTLKSLDRVDYIITHTAPLQLIKTFITPDPDSNEFELNGFFDWIMYEYDFKSWYFGHWHDDREFSFKIEGRQKNFRLLWFDMVQIK